MMRSPNLSQQPRPAIATMLSLQSGIPADVTNHPALDCNDFSALLEVCVPTLATAQLDFVEDAVTVENTDGSIGASAACSEHCYTGGKSLPLLLPVNANAIVPDKPIGDGTNQDASNLPERRQTIQGTLRQVSIKPQIIVSSASDATSTPPITNLVPIALKTESEQGNSSSANSHAASASQANAHEVIQVGRLESNAFERHDPKPRDTCRNLTDAVAQATSLPGSSEPQIATGSPNHPAMQMFEPATKPDHAIGMTSPTSGRDVELLVARIVEARTFTQPAMVKASLSNVEFGQVAVHFDVTGKHLSATLVNADPAFVPSVHHAASIAADVRRDSNPPHPDTNAQPAPQQGFQNTATSQERGSGEQSREHRQPQRFDPASARDNAAEETTSRSWPRRRPDGELFA